MTDSADQTSPLMAYLSATAEQLDIASEDTETALNDVLETFEAAASCMETLEHALNHEGPFDRHTLLATTTALRAMLRRSVVSLQFQDRLMQRLALASRELRNLGDDSIVEQSALDPQSLKVPRSVSSLYDPRQMSRIVAAAGGDSVFQNEAHDCADDDDITLF